MTKLVELAPGLEKVEITGKVIDIQRKFSGPLWEDVLRIRLADDSGEIALSPLWLSKSSFLPKLEVGDTLQVYGNMRDSDFYVDTLLFHRLSPEHQKQVEAKRAEKQAQEKEIKRILANRKRQITRERNKRREESKKK